MRTTSAHSIGNACGWCKHISSKCRKMHCSEVEFEHSVLHILRQHLRIVFILYILPLIPMASHDSLARIAIYLVPLEWNNAA